MKALSLLQPWATLVAIGAKQIETRSWANSYRGPLAIHASKAFPRDLQDLCEMEPFRSALARGGYTTPSDLPRGAVVAVARKTGCFYIVKPNGYGPALWSSASRPPKPVPEEELPFGDYTPGRYGWTLTEARTLRPIPARGSLGLWEWDLPCGLDTTLDLLVSHYTQEVPRGQ